MTDTGVGLRKELAMGQKGAKAEAAGNRERTGKYTCGGLVKKPTPKKGKK